MKHFILIIICIICYAVQAQHPWRAKLIVYFEHADNRDSLIGDTIWVGCDSAGAAGYQPGLDVLASQVEPYHIYSVDDSLPGQYLKTNIKGFKKKEITEFKFKCNGKVKYIIWDSLEHMYETDTMFLLYSYLEAKEGVSLDIPHMNFIQLSKRNKETHYRGNFSYPNKAEVIEGGELLNFTLGVRFDDTTVYILNGIKQRTKEYGVRVGYDNDNETIGIYSDKKIGGIVRIYSIGGILLIQKEMNSSFCQIPLQGGVSGLYILNVSNEQSLDYTTKFIKAHQ
jgi:hypothetical protein